MDPPGVAGGLGGRQPLPENKNAHLVLSQTAATFMGALYGWVVFKQLLPKIGWCEYLQVVDETVA